MVTLYDVPAEDLITEVADRLADRIDEPEWAGLVKGSAHNELPPEQDDFWYVRSASVLRKVALKQPIGVERLATEYGGKKAGTNRYQVAPGRHAGGSRNLIRTALQELEDADLIRTAQGEGRRLTDDGRAFLDDAAADVFESLDRPDLERYA